MRFNKAAHFEIEKRLSENIISNSKNFHSYVKSKHRSTYKIGPLKNDRDEIIVKDAVLNDYFLSFFTKEDVGNVLIPQQMIHRTEYKNS